MTFIIQIFIFLLYFLFTYIYIWPYINKVILKREKKVLLSLNTLKYNKKKIILLQKKILFRKRQYQELFTNLKLQFRHEKELLFEQIKLKYKNKYNQLYIKVKNKLLLEKKSIYVHLISDIDKLLYLLINNLSCHIFNKNKDNQYINTIIVNYFKKNQYKLLKDV